MSSSPTRLSPGPRMATTGHHFGGMNGQHSGWNLEDSLRTEVDETMRKNRALGEERDYYANQMVPLREEAERLTINLANEVEAHNVTKEELRQVEAKYAAAMAALKARMESEMAWRDVKLDENEAEIKRLNRLLQEHVQRLQELERSKYAEIEKLKAQLQAERESATISIDSLERELSSLQRQVDYAAQDLEREKERAAAKLKDEETDHRRDVDELQRQLELERKERRQQVAALQETLAKEKAAANKKILQLEQALKASAMTVKDLEAELAEERAARAAQVAALKAEVAEERAGRLKAEEERDAMQPKVDAALSEVEVWKQKCLVAEELFLQWEAKMQAMQAILEAGMGEALTLKAGAINSELPAVYQVHALEPLVQVKVTEMHDALCSIFAQFQSNLRVHMPDVDKRTFPVYQ